MNEKRITWLAGLLVVQLLAVAALLLSRGGFTEPPVGALLDFDPAAIDGVVIEESEEKSIALTKTEGAWSLPGAIPADAEKITKLLEKLAALRSPWPVATTSGARERFEVGEDDRQRHLVLQSGGKTAAELLLGTSPGFRRLHVRIPGADAIYEVDLTHFEMSTSADEWMDRAVLAATGEVTAVAREGGWRLARSDDGWMLDDGAADSNAAEQMAARFANLRVLGLPAASAQDSTATGPDAVATPQDAAAEAPAAAEFTVSDTKGHYRLRLYGTPDGGDYEIVSDRAPGRYRLAAFVAEQLLAEAATLLPAANPPADPAAATGEGAADAAASVPEPAADAAAPAPEPAADAATMPPDGA